MATAVAGGEFREEAAREVLDIATMLQRDAALRSAGTTLSSCIEESGRSVFLERSVFSTAQEASGLNERLAEKIAERDDLLENPGLRFAVGFTGHR